MDTLRDGWDSFERVRQTGRETGNDELEDFVPEQVQIRDGGGGQLCALVLTRTEHRWLSGKIRSRQNLTELRPNGGQLEVVVQGPNLQFFDGRKCRYARGAWPAVWLLPHAPWPTGGEIDLLEQMMFKRGDENRGFSTLHFGPHAGKDYSYPGHWGLHLGTYDWDDKDHVLKFAWLRRGGAWNLSLSVDGKQVWAFSTKREGVLAVGMEAGAGFREGEPGDPAAIFQRAFDDAKHGLSLVVNLSYGGRPFGDTQADLKSAEFMVKRVTVT
jgi:hypothetical protein